MLKEGLKAGLNEGSSFYSVVLNVLANYRSTIHTTTACSPAQLMFGREMRMPLNVMHKTLNEDTKNEQHLHSAVKKRVHFQHQKYAEYYDQKKHVKPHIIMVGDLVRIKIQSKSHKLEPDWSEPVKVVALCGESSVRLSNGKTWNVRDCLLHKPVLRQQEEDEEPQWFDLSIQEHEQQEQPPTSPNIDQPLSPTRQPRRSSRQRRPKQPYSPG